MSLSCDCEVWNPCTGCYKRFLTPNQFIKWSRAHMLSTEYGAMIERICNDWQMINLGGHITYRSGEEGPMTEMRIEAMELISKLHQRIEVCESIIEKMRNRYVEQLEKRCADIINSTSVVKGMNARFITFTVDKKKIDGMKIDWDVFSGSDFSKVIQERLNGKTNIRPEKYIGCIEAHKSGALHAHVLCAYGSVDKRYGLGKSMFQKYWPYGNIDVQNVNYKRNPDSIKDILTYISKEPVCIFNRDWENVITV